MEWTNFLTKFFDQSFASRWTGACSGWTKELVIAHVLADILIFIAYMTIPILLIKIIKKRKDMPFGVFFFMFAIFIIGCGLTHLMNVITSFNPYYYIDFWVKVLTTIASVGTAFLLWKKYPQMIKLPNPWTALSVIENTNKKLAISNKELLTANKINKELEDFALIAAHDLQDPLKQNNVFLRMIKEGKLEFIKEMESNNLRMDDFVKNLLTFARSGGMNIKIRKVDMNNVIKNVIKDLQTLIISSGAKIEIKDMPEIECDLVQISRVFQNLLKNSIKYRSTDRLLEIEISSKFNNNCWSFSVKDNGIGIEKDKLNTLFTVYRGIKNNGSGSGFGLAICKRIVESHEGTISVKSEPEKGTCFTFTINDFSKE